jgi:hypothetical protein
MGLKEIRCDDKCYIYLEQWGSQMGPCEPSGYINNRKVLAVSNCWLLNVCAVYSYLGIVVIGL